MRVIECVELLMSISHRMQYERTLNLAVLVTKVVVLLIYNYDDCHSGLEEANDMRRCLGSV